MFYFVPIHKPINSLVDTASALTNRNHPGRRSGREISLQISAKRRFSSDPRYIPMLIIPFTTARTSRSVGGKEYLPPKIRCRRGLHHSFTYRKLQAPACDKLVLSWLNFFKSIHKLEGFRFLIRISGIHSYPCLALAAKGKAL